MAKPTCPVKVRSLGRTLSRWHHEIIAWHETRPSHGPPEAANNLIKRVKRGAFGFTSFQNYGVRSLLHARRPKCTLLTSVIPR